MARSKMERVYVPFFCELCGKEAFEGRVFGREVERQVFAENGTRRMVCDHCKNPTRSFSIAPLGDWASQPLVFLEAEA